MKGDEPIERVRLALANRRLWGVRRLWSVSPEDIEYLLRQYDALAAAIPILRAAHENQKNSIVRLRASHARLLEALKTTKRSHYSCDDRWYSCPRSEDGSSDECAGNDCNCGADEFNARIAAIAAAEGGGDG